MTTSAQRDLSAGQHGPLGSSKLDSWLLTYFGPSAWWFKEHWVFALVTFIGVLVPIVALYFVPKQSDGSVQTWVVFLVVVCGTAGALAVLGDKLADRFERKTAELRTAEYEAAENESLLALETSAQHSISEINWLLEKASRIPFLKGAARANQIENVRFDVVKAAASAIGPGARATYYTLESDSRGRRLVNPKHSVTIGRSDRPDTPWIEADSPTHEIWTILGRSDTEPPVIREGDDASGLDWDKVQYRCFLSVPVKARTATFGLLSVNASEVGAIQETERALILTVARILALIEATHLGPERAGSLLDLSDPSVKLQTDEEGADDVDIQPDAESNS